MTRRSLSYANVSQYPWDSEACPSSWLVSFPPPFLPHHFSFYILLVTGPQKRGRVCVCVGFPSGASGREPACQWSRHERHGLSPWIGKIPWRRAWQPTSVFLPGESPWAEEPGRLQSIGLHRVGHDWSDLAHTYTCICVYNIQMWWDREIRGQRVYEILLRIKKDCFGPQLKLVKAWIFVLFCFTI